MTVIETKFQLIREWKNKIVVTHLVEKKLHKRWDSNVEIVTVYKNRSP